MSPRIMSHSSTPNRSRVAIRCAQQKERYRSRVNIHTMGTTIIIDKVVVPRTCSGCAHHKVAPSITRPQRLRWRDATSWQKKLQVVGYLVLDAATVAGSVVFFILSRVGVGLRGEEIAAFFNRGNSR